MRAHSIRLRNFRNHSDSTVEGLSGKINVLAGPNGAGKTSILEGLSLATLTKSFTTYSDAVLIRSGETMLEVEANFESDLGVPHRVAVEITLGPPIRKTITANSERLRSSAELVGRAPVVVLTPDEKIITSGPPSERRRFLNMVLSQASRTYLEDELEYRRALKQRNAILADAKQQRRSLSYVQSHLAPWTALVIKHGARIMRRRSSFTDEFRPRLLRAYALLSEDREGPTLSYLPMGLEDIVTSDFESLLTDESKKNEIEEIRRGTTLFGPHRDELVLNINPKQSAKFYASQGQHKTLLVAMKLAEFEYLKEAAGETPILLLDDVFSELDELRAHQLLDLAESGHFGQTFITSTDRQRFRNKLDFSKENRMFIVESGHIQETV
ncbi:MAG TPA: DNA replication/repair protein RecF [Candidatus Kapabacteria bacterium]|jgi:DNA replication and repair protein RecF|nr:DNA replication/repair protein RecF [Candidatus Kapabacteria bacterium]